MIFDWFWFLLIMVIRMLLDEVIYIFEGFYFGCLINVWIVFFLIMFRVLFLLLLILIYMRLLLIVIVIFNGLFFDIVLIDLINLFLMW